MKSIIICGSPRTGGNYLCKLLRDEGIGCGDEWAAPRLRDLYMRSYKLREDDYWPMLWELRSASRVFVVKLHFAELAYPWIGDNPRTVVPSAWPTWVYQHRADIDKQAESWALAQTTGEWYGKSKPGTATKATVEHCRRAAEHQHQAWEDWFTKKNIVPIRIEFEKLFSDPEGVIRRTVNAL